MPNDDILTDDYVAELLAKDAKESSIKYSTIGLQAFSSSSKPPTNKPKPNTRFLRNIIKETDNHNAALLAKEAAEARARLRELPKNEPPKSKFTGGDIRRRQLGDIAAILGGRPTKRRRTEEQKKERRRANTSSEDEEPEEKHKAVAIKPDRRYTREDREEREDYKRSRSYRHRPRGRSASPDLAKQIEERRRRHRSRSRSPRDRHSKDSRHRHRSPRRRPSRTPEPEGRRDRSRRSKQRYSSSTEREAKSEKAARNLKSQPDTKMDDDSDPLDEIIGPRPPSIPKVRTRGRGTISQASGIDQRFSESYDPNADVQLDPEEVNDWDQALEALRDRQKWKQQGADRLRAAGFTDEEVKKWEKGGEKREEDVKWAKRGEGREWDRGKVVDEIGDVGIESAFGRLKDT